MTEKTVVRKRMSLAKGPVLTNRYIIEPV